MDDSSDFSDKDDYLWSTSAQRNLPPIREPTRSYVSGSDNVNLNAHTLPHVRPEQIKLEIVDDDADDLQKKLPPFSKSRKNFIVAVVSLCGLVAPLASNIYFPALVSVQKDLQASDIMINATISVFIFVMGIAPVIWAPFSDLRGRQAVYVVSNALFAVSSLLCGLSVNAVMLIIFRVFQAFGSSAVIAVGAGTISDIFEPRERGLAMGWFFMGPLIGPIIGPIIGGYMNQYVGWRSIFYLLAGIGVVFEILIVFLLPETLMAARLRALNTKQAEKNMAFAQRMKKRFSVDWKNWTSSNPLRILVLLKDPVVLITR